jgi:hypothetical protein
MVGPEYSLAWSGTRLAADDICHRLNHQIDMVQHITGTVPVVKWKSLGLLDEVVLHKPLQGTVLLHAV